MGFIRLEPRLDPLAPIEYGARIALGGALAVAAGTLILLATGHDPLVAFKALARGAFGSERAVTATLNKAVPIGLCAIGIALASRARLWNIGAEGQLYMGAFAGAGVGLFLPAESPAVLGIPLLLLAGAMAGGLWAGIAATMRTALGVNEILSTLMLTYVAILWVEYLVTGPWADPMTFTFPYSARLVEGARIGNMFGDVHFGFAVLLAAVAALALVDRGLRWGYTLRVIGDAPAAARYGGIDGARGILTALVAGGMLAGLAGAIEVSASTGRLQAGLSPGYGFIAILVAWLAAGQPLAILAASLLYAALLNGGFALQVSGIPPAIGTILQALLLITTLAAVGLASYRIRLARSDASLDRDKAGRTAQ